MTDDIKPFTINIPQERLDDLHQRLKLTRFPDELDDAGWDMGAPVAEVRRFVEHWRDKFDWRAAEARLNKLPHYTTSITVDGFEPFQMHLVHQPSEVPNAIPLLYAHGWPGSFLEGSKIVDKLSGNGIDSPAFHVVVVSLPNFGFSSGPSKRGFALEQYAEALHKVMLKLGYDQYVTQGGDWGFYITRTMSLLFPAHCKATHINFDSGAGPPAWSQYPRLALEHAFRPYSEQEKEGLRRNEWFAKDESAYRILQITKPTTLAYSFADSPSSLMAWLYEKLHNWTDDYNWTEDEVCTWVSIYWFSTAGPGASIRLYYEAEHTPPGKITYARADEWIDGVKIGYSHQPKELRISPSTWYRKLGNITFDRFNEKGGHFFAYEVPNSCIRDVRDMFRKGAGAYGVVEGKDGYL